MADQLPIPRELMNVSGATQRPSKKFSEALAANLALLGELYRQELTELAVVAYRESLQDLSVEQMNLGFQQAVKRCKFLPTPAEIREEVEIALSRKQRPREAAEDCDLCRGTGWKRIQHPEGVGVCVVKCDCRIDRGGGRGG